MKYNHKSIEVHFVLLLLVVAVALFTGCSGDKETHNKSNEGHVAEEAEHNHADHDLPREIEEALHAGHDHEGGHETDEDGHEGHDHGIEAAEANLDHDAEEEDHSGHSDHDVEAEEGLQLTDEQRERFGIVVRTAEGGNLLNEVSLPGEIVFNEDRVVHLVPRVAGIARDVRKSVGDEVQEGEILAVIESRELADAKAEYLAAKARAALAVKSFTRETALREKRISSEQEYLEVEQALAEARIELRSAGQKLHALGLSESYVELLDVEHDATITRYEVRSPITGVVTERHISLGESLEADTDIFTVVDLSSVWVNLTVYAKDIATVRRGQSVNICVDHNGAQAGCVVSMVTPFVNESTRSATARVLLDNSDGQWIPGTFVTGFISLSQENLAVIVPRNALQNIEGRDIVFVEHEGVFEMTPVTTGRADRNSIEIVDGLEPGTPYVTDGSFQLKATVVTSNLDSHAGHGH